MRYESLIPLGSRVMDVITGVKGVVVSVNFHLTGCTRYWIETRLYSQTGADNNDTWVDEARLEVIGKIIELVNEEVVKKAPAPADCGPPSASPRP